MKLSSPDWRASLHRYRWRYGVAFASAVIALTAALHWRSGSKIPSPPLFNDPALHPIAMLVSADNVAGAVARLEGSYHFDQRNGLNALRVFSMLVLERGLDDRDVFERYFAASALATAGNREGIHLLERGFDNPDLSIKMAAADDLGEIGDAYAVGILERLYDSASDFDRRIVVNGLASATDRRAITILSDAVSRSDGTLRLAALEGLGKLGDRDATPLLRKMMAAPNPPMEQAMAAASLLKLGESVDLALIEALLADRKNGSARTIAALALGYAHDPGALPTLKQAMSDDDIDVRIAVAAALTHYHDPAGVAYLKRAMLDGDDSITRQHVGQVLDQVAFDGGYEVLIGAVGSLDPNLQMSGVRALGLRGGPKEVELFNQMLPHAPDPLLRAQVAWSLGRIGCAEAIGTLLRLVPETDPAVRYTAADALGRAAQRRLTEIRQ